MTTYHCTAPNEPSQMFLKEVLEYGPTKDTADIHWVWVSHINGA